MKNSIAHKLPQENTSFGPPFKVILVTLVSNSFNIVSNAIFYMT